MGHDVSVYHPITMQYMEYKWPKWLRVLVFNLLRLHRPRWHRFKYNVALKLVPELNNDTVADAEVIFATWWGTAYIVNDLEALKGKKFYMVFEVEKPLDSSIYPKELSLKTYQLPIRKIILTGNTMAGLENAVHPLKNYYFLEHGVGLDVDSYAISRPLSERDSSSIGYLLLTPVEVKRPFDAFKAFQIVYEKHPTARFMIASSAFTRAEFKKMMVKVCGKAILSRIDYIHKASNEKLIEMYNKCSVFVSSSRYEGFGLPGAESMACGCALATTDSGGVRDYAINGETALMSPPKDHEALAKNILTLVEDTKFRQDLAARGNRFIQQFGWRNLAMRLEQLLVSNGN